MNRPISALSFDDDRLYQALLEKDLAYEGFAYVGVTSTGIYCRLSCTARKPKRENTVFFQDIMAAEAAGFRACLRCHPKRETEQVPKAIATLKDQVINHPDGAYRQADLKAKGFDPSTLRRAFQKAYGQTFSQFVRTQRLGRAMKLLSQSGDVVDAQIEAGYESASGFRDAITRLIGETPSRLDLSRLLTAGWLDTPLGSMVAVVDQDGVYLLEFYDRKALPTEIKTLLKTTGPIAFGPHAMLDRTQAALNLYFKGEDLRLDLPILMGGTAFQRHVWEKLLEIPVGETRSYGQLANWVGNAGASRAVARANGANPLCLIVPCHRVIGADGSLTGYGGKLWRKQWLLEHERRHAPRASRAPLQGTLL